MPRAFDITAATDSVRLDASGQGELAFTVSNALRVPMRARASVQVSDGARPEWTQLTGGEERDFTADGTQQFTVRFQVPKGTPPGRYTLQLLVVDVANPDERYAQGPTVAFTVPEAVLPAKKAFPWLWVALGVGVVVIIGTVVAVLAGRGEERIPPGQTRCTADAECPPQQKCVQVLNTQTCLLVPGTECARDLDCSSLYCREGTCTRDDGRCEDNQDCKPPSQCAESKLCLLPDGEPCTANDVCMSGFCGAGRCAPAPVSECNPPCPRFSRCFNGRCVFIRPRVNQDLLIQQQPRLQQELQQRIQR